MNAIRDYTNQTAGDGEFQVICLGEQGDDSAEDGLAPDSALLRFGDNARPNFDFVSQLQDTRQDRAASNTALQIVNLGARLVDVKRPNDNHVGRGGKVPDGNGDLVDKGLVDGIDVELELGGNGDDW